MQKVSNRATTYPGFPRKHARATPSAPRSCESLRVREIVLAACSCLLGVLLKVGFGGGATHGLVGVLDVEVSSEEGLLLAKSSAGGADGLAGEDGHGDERYQNAKKTINEVMWLEEISSDG